MTFKQEMSNFGQRLADFAARFDTKRQPGKNAKPPLGKPGGSTTFPTSLRDLFTQGVTRDDFKHMVDRDAREALRFYMREIDLEEFRPLPWYRRYPMLAWRIFIALAYRLSPVRRITFAVATALFLFGWIQLLILKAQAEGVRNNGGALWLLISFALLLLVLLLELRDKLDLKGDLEIAREIQFGLVPEGPFHQNRIRVHCSMRPANTVGGDYYDVIELGPNHLGLVIADVAGKGMPAALLMALLQGSLRTLITAGHRGSDLIVKLNAYLCSSIPDNSLITLFYGEMDTITGDLAYVNAGHNAPLLLRKDQSLEPLPSTALVLGVDPDSAFVTMTTRMDPSDLLLLYTDGISEAFNLKEEEYGDERIGAFLREHQNHPAGVLLQELLHDVLSHSGSARLKDDMTLMAVTRDA